MAAVGSHNSEAPTGGTVNHTVLTATVVIDSIAIVVLGVMILRHLRQNGTGHDFTEEVTQLRSMRSEIHRLSGRMTQFEADYHQIIVRIDAMAFAQVERQKELSNVLSDMTASSMAMLETVQKIRGSYERVEREVHYIRKTLDERPCVYNETNNGGESCPDGQPIEGAGKMAPVDRERER